MNVFLAIETACASVVERTFARVFPSELTPAQIARKLVTTLQSNPAPIYLVRLHPRDYEQLGAHRGFLEAEWTSLLQRTAQEIHGGALAPRVVLHEDATVAAGVVTIDALRDDGPLDDDAEAQASIRTASLQPLALRGVRGASNETLVPLDADVILGRASDADVVLADPRVSRRHAALTREASGITVRDLGSTNGTFVNAQRIDAPRALAVGDRITVGDSDFVVERR